MIENFLSQMIHMRRQGEVQNAQVLPRETLIIT